MASAGLRERKKQQTRQLIADAAAALFGERGYEHVSVSDFAKAAEVPPTRSRAVSATWPPSAPPSGGCAWR